MTPKAPLGSRTITIALVVALAQFMQVLDAAVISIALPPMARGFGVSPVTAGLGITVYVLTTSIVIPASAWFADRFGARRIFVLAVAGFTLASLFCGLSRSLPEFICARALQGTAGALMAPIGQLILLRSVDRAQLLRIMNITSAPMLLAPVLGPPLGGFLATWVGWPSIFYINVPAGFLAIVAAMRWFPDFKGDRRPFDRTGFLLNTLALSPLLWGLGELGDPGKSHIAAVCAVMAGLGFGYLALRHARNSPHPLLPLDAWRHLSFRVATGPGFLLLRMPITATLFVIPLMLQAGFGFSAFMAGMLFLGHSGGDLLMKLFMTRTFKRFGYRSVLLASSTLMCAAMASTAAFSAATPLVVITLVLFASGSFRSFVMTGVSTLALADVAPSEAPSATTLSQVTLQLSIALGVTLSSILINASDHWLGVPSGAPTVEACRITILIMAALGAMAIPIFLQLHEHAGAELSGRPTGVSQATAEEIT